MNKQRITAEQLDDSNIAASLNKLHEYDVLLYTSIRNQIRNGGMDADVFQVICEKPFHMPIHVLHKLINLFSSQASVEVYEVLCTVFQERSEDEYALLLELVLKGIGGGLLPDMVYQVIYTSDTLDAASVEMDRAIKSMTDHDERKTEQLSDEEKDKDEIIDGEYTSAEVEKKRKPEGVQAVFEPESAAGQSGEAAVKEIDNYGMHPVQVFYPSEPDNPPFFIKTNDDLFKAIEHLITRLRTVYMTQQRHLARVENTSVSQLHKIKELETLLAEEK